MKRGLLSEFGVVKKFIISKNGDLIDEIINTNMEDDAEFVKNKIPFDNKTIFTIDDGILSGSISQSTSGPSRYLLTFGRYDNNANFVWNKAIEKIPAYITKDGKESQFLFNLFSLMNGIDNGYVFIQPLK